METPETRAKLAGAIRQLQATGDTATIERLVSAYKTKYKTPQVKPFAQSPVEKQNMRADIQSDIAQSAQEAQNTTTTGGAVPIPTSLGGLANFGKALVSNLAPSQVGLGQTLAKIANIGQADKTAQLSQDTADTQVKLAQLIRKQKAEGKDTTKLEGLFNEGQKQMQELTGSISDLPKTSTVVGQLGGSALDLLTAGQFGKATVGMKSGSLATKSPSVAKLVGTAVSPELTQVSGTQASGLFTKKGLGNIAKNTGIGYASDVTSGLAGIRGEDRTGAKSLIPGAGTALTGGISTLGEIGQTLKNVASPDYKVNKLVEKRSKELDKLDNYVALKKQTEKGLERGIDIKKVLAETDVLHGSVDKNGTISTLGKGGAVDQYRTQYVDGNEAIVSQALKKENRAVAPNLVKSKLRKAILDSGLEGSSLVKAEKAIENEMAGYARRAGANNTIPLSTLHDAKVDKYSNINFMTDLAKQKYDKAIANALKEIVEENTTSINVKNVNKELSKHFAVMGYLEKLDNKKVEGGRLGKYFASTIGAIVGSKLGPLGAIAGAELGGRVKGNLMSRAFKGKTNILPKQAEAITQAKGFITEKPLQIGQSSNMSGSLNTSQASTIAPTTIGISKTIPEETYLSQGIREGKDILSNLKNKQIGMSVKDVSPQTIAKNVSGEDLRIIRAYLNNESPDALFKAQPLLEAFQIDKFPDDLQRRFLGEIITESTKKLPVKSLTDKLPKGNYTKSTTGKFTGSLPKSNPLITEAKKLKGVEQNWSKLQKENPELFNKGILRKSYKPVDAVGEIPEKVHSIQSKWQNYGEFDEIEADKVYKRIESGAFKGEYEDKFGNPVRDDNGRVLQDVYDESIGEWVKPMVSNRELRNALLDEFSTKEGKQYLNEVVKALPKNPDGTITAYRVGKIGADGVQSYTLSEGMAKTFSNQGTGILPAGTPGLPSSGYKDFGSLPTNIVKIDPKGIQAWSPYDAEILVESKYVKKIK